VVERLSRRAFRVAVAMAALVVPATGRAAAKGWPLVHVSDPVAAAVARAALDAAQDWAAQPACTHVVEDFRDEAGRPLTERLASFGADLAGYLEMLTFVDDSRHQACRSGIVAFTEPGSRVVRICSDELKRRWREQPRDTKAAFLHETLHTLGLGENPPTSREITERVLARCGR
jgi:hypothetical protein